MKPRAVLAMMVALVTVGVSARLGLWQVARMHEKQSLRASFDSTLAAEPTPIATLRTGAPLAHRKVGATGTYDSAHQFLLSARSHEGDTGVGVVTPLVMADGRAVLVDRGWMPALDAMTADPTAVAEPGEQSVVGLAREIPAASGPTRWVRLPNQHAILWSTYSLSRDSLAARVPYPLLGVLIEQLPGPGVPAIPRREAPERPDPAMHFWYAVQWFAVAMIVGIGSFVLGRRVARAAHAAPPTDT
ncbi:MAG: SURF1 family protein [Candidatus Eisenbacteria bacterium]